ncbi:hypothetical protein [Pyrococcus yayanosii]|nr:hypothetical protein [Pyrococcus yayanosii]
MIEKLAKVREAIERGKLEEAIKISKNINDPYWKSYAMKWLSQAMASKNPAEARRLASSIPIPSLRNEALLYLAYELSKRGKFKDAVDSARLIVDVYMKKKALRSISDALAEALKKMNIIEISLGELGLEEADVELLKPLPEGIKYEDGRFLVDATILPVSEEKGSAVVEMRDEKANLKEPELEPLEMELLELTEENFENLPEPFRSALIESIGLHRLEEGDVEAAEELVEKITIGGGTLARLLFFLGREEHLEKVRRPVDRILLAYRVLLLKPTDDAIPLIYTLFSDLRNRNPWKFARLMKFLAFELLEEGRKRRNKALLIKSKELFRKGKEEELSATAQASL